MIQPKHLLLLIWLSLVATSASAQQTADALPSDTTRPNILWIYVEDTNDNRGITVKDDGSPQDANIASETSLP